MFPTAHISDLLRTYASHGWEPSIQLAVGTLEPENRTEGSEHEGKGHQ